MTIAPLRVNNDPTMPGVRFVVRHPSSEGGLRHPMWPYETPCQKRAELFTPRRGGEDYSEYVMRADAARMTCENLCDRSDDCRDYTIRRAVTGICAGSLYEEGVKLEWPTVRPYPATNANGYRKWENKRESLCCAECDEPYNSQTANPLCVNCRRKAYLFYTGGDVGGESQPSFIGYQSSGEAA